MGIPVTVVMPVVAPIMKVENCKRYGANVVIHGADIGEARVLALKIGRKKGMQYVNGYDHPNILAGQGTMGLEILDQVPDVEAIVIPVGGGGLIAGTAKAVKTMKPDVMIIGTLALHFVTMEMTNKRRSGTGDVSKLHNCNEARQGGLHANISESCRRSHRSHGWRQRARHWRAAHRQDGDRVRGVDRHRHPQADRAGEGGGGGRRSHWACRLARWHVARAEGEEVRIGKDTDLAL